MHICFLCSEYPPALHGGIGTFTRTLGRAVAARGHRVTVVGVYPIPREIREDDEGVHVVRIPHARIAGAGFAVNGLRLRRAIRAIHAESPIDVLEGQENSLAMLPRRFVAPKIIRMNGGHQFFAVTLGRKPAVWRSWIERRSFRRADFLSGVSRYVATKTCELLRLNPDAVEVLPNPVDTSVFFPRPSTDAETRTVVFVGTVAEKKGIRQLILAMPQIVNAVPDARLWVIGPDSREETTGASYTEWVRSCIPPDLAPQILFKGRVENTALPDTIANAAVCVYPSHMEALPIAFLEGMAMGKPVVASQAGPGPEVVEHGVSGLLCDPHDPQSIAQQVTRVLTDPELSRRLGRQAHQAVATQFSIDVLTEKNLQWYQRCIAAYRSRREADSALGNTPGATRSS
jgi:glycosyltransferase involved in cell wall biosynthesis